MQVLTKSLPCIVNKKSDHLFLKSQFNKENIRKLFKKIYKQSDIDNLIIELG